MQYSGFCCPAGKKNKYLELDRTNETGKRAWQWHHLLLVCFKGLQRGLEELKNQRNNRDHPNSIVKIDQNTEKSPGGGRDILSFGAKWKALSQCSYEKHAKNIIIMLSNFFFFINWASQLKLIWMINFNVSGQGNFYAVLLIFC